MICEPLANIFRSGRDHFNHAHAEARRRFPEFDDETFTAFLTKTLDPIAVRASASRINDERLADLVMAAYEIGLELTGERIIGHDPKRQLVEEGWRQIIPNILPQTAADPRRVLISLGNALHQLGATAGARPSEWISQLSKLGASCPDVTTLLQTGQILAWRAGMAHYREGALAIAQHLPAPLALAALGAPADTNAVIANIIALLQKNPWYNPTLATAPNNQELPVVAKVGSYRGYGGQFTELPQIAVNDGLFFVRSGENHWLLHADTFGATWHHANADDFLAAQKTPQTPPNISVRITPEHIACNGRLRANPLPNGECRGYAANATTLALTSPHSYQMTLIALAT